MVNDLKMSKMNLFLNVFMIAIFILLEIVSIFVLKNTTDTRLLLRVLARGIFGLLMFYNSLFLLFTNKQSFLTRRIATNQRKLCGILIGVVGIIMVATALLGYGTNGDPRLIWWK